MDTCTCIPIVCFARTRIISCSGPGEPVHVLLFLHFENRQFRSDLESHNEWLFQVFVQR